MIISQIIGGLGNQMFQYAAGRSLSLQRGQPLHLDIAGFIDHELHQGFELQRVLDCPVEIASKTEICNILGWQSPAPIRRLAALPGMAIFRPKELLVEPHFHYWPEIGQASQNCYLVGYWQSEKYFSAVAPVIRADFTFRNPLAERNAELAEQIGSVTAVSLHVRRGDYAHHPKTLAMHGLCSLDYYSAAIRHISRSLARPYFFIFSDDVLWVKDNLQIDFPCQYVTHNQGAASYNDMHLMSLCKHHIIANSSFSWWAAWLNPDPDKIVIAPKKWFATSLNTSDLLPTSWVTL